MKVEDYVEKLKWCYKKFKSYVYYSNTLTHIKYKIIEFESKEKFLHTFEVIGEALYYKKDDYFSSLINKTNWIPQIKKLENKSVDNESVVSNLKNDNNIVVDKINYFIDVPIELYIIDTFWTILFGETLKEKKYDSSCLKANEFAASLYNSQEGVDGINFENIGLFKPYYKNYQEWRSGAIKKVSHLYDSGKNSTIISLDLTGYYYTVDLPFNYLKSISSIKGFEYSYLTDILEKINYAYRIKLKGVTKLVGDNRLLPIGLLSSMVLANYYLNDFDLKIKTHDNVVYYSRYVDDLLIVVSDIIECESAKDTLNYYFPDMFVFEEEMIRLRQFENCYIQNKKIKIIRNHKDSSKALIESLKTDLPHPSEANLLPNIENSDIYNFLADVFDKKSDSIKIRDNDGLELNKYKLMRFMSSYVISKKNTLPCINRYKKKKYEKLDSEMYRQLELFFDNYILFTLWNRWEKIFEFTYLNDDGFELTKKIINKIDIGIMSIIINDADIFNRKVNIVLNKIKKHLESILVYSFAAVLALRPLKEECDLSFIKKAKQYYKKIRKANMMNHNLIGFPLINYLKKEDNSNSMDLFNMQESEIHINNYGLGIFDKNKIDYSPRYIHFGEYMLFRNLVSISDLNDREIAKKMLDEFNNLFDKHLDYYTTESYSNHDLYVTTKIKMNAVFDETALDEIYVALGNIDLSKHNLIKNGRINLNEYKTVDNKIELFKLLNECLWTSKKVFSLEIADLRFVQRIKRKMHVNFLAFPELYLPFEWLNDVMKFSRKNGIGIITGVKYCKRVDKVGVKKLINTIACIIPFKDENNCKCSCVFMREKNDYSPDEKEFLSANGYGDPTKPQSFNYIFEWGGVRFAALNCFELTDIRARANLKSHVDIIFVPEFNRDLSYFSSIIESTSKDDGCFVAQVNSSHIGDTRIVGPMHSNYSNICAISGGEKNGIHIGKINLKEYREYRAYENSDEFIWDLKKKYEKKNKKQVSKKVRLIEKYKRSSARLD